MNEYMNEISCEIFSSFDTKKRASKKAQPERFYHGFVLGLMVELRSRYIITSNRESGFGRYDVMLEPKNPQIWFCLSGKRSFDWVKVVNYDYKKRQYASFLY